MREREIDYLLKDLQRAGVRKLRFISKNVATDQLGRKIVFKRTVVKGFVSTTFEIIN